MPVKDTLQTLRDYWRYAVTQFENAKLSFGHGNANATDEAAYLLLWALHLPLDRLEFFLDAKLLPAEKDKILALIDQRIASRLPAAYLTKEAWLQGHRFYVDERCLIPRSFLAELLDDALAPWLPEDEQSIELIADMCTGGGSLAILAALRFAHAQVQAFDLSADALKVAERNVSDYGLGERVTLYQTNLFEGVGNKKKFDLVLCNPPYVNEISMAQLPPEFRHEPKLALAGGSDGMDILRRLLPQLRNVLNNNGIAVIEIGHERKHFEQAFPNLEVVWLPTSQGDDQVFLLPRQSLLTLK